MRNREHLSLVHKTGREPKGTVAKNPSPATPRALAPPLTDSGASRPDPFLEAFDQLLAALDDQDRRLRLLISEIEEQYGLA